MGVRTGEWCVWCVVSEQTEASVVGGSLLCNLYLACDLEVVGIVLLWGGFVNGLRGRREWDGV